MRDAVSNLSRTQESLLQNCMTETLFDFQVEGANWLASQQVGLLADEMGVGKSAQVVTACDLIRAQKILIVCPAIARVNWAREFTRFSKSSRQFTIITEAMHLLIASDSMILSYEMAASHRQKITQNFDVIILDEVHYLKSKDAQRTKAILGNAGIIRQASRCWALSGTPAPNHPGELWPLLYTFGATKMGYEEFLQYFCNGYYGPRGLVITGTKQYHIPYLRKILEPVILRRKKEDVLKQIPPIHFDHVAVEASPVNLDLFLGIQNLETVLEHQTGVVRNSLKVLEAISKSVSTLRRYTGLQKVKSAATLIREELENHFYQKIVVFAVHQNVIDQLKFELRDFNPLVLYGKTTPLHRQERIDHFQNKAECRIFICNVQACGTAINLTAANQVLFVESEWTPAYNAQAAMRCHRIGQERPVFVRFLGLAHSLDEKINQILERKTRDLVQIFDTPPA